MKLSKKRITMALISLRGCTDWSAPLLFAKPEDGFSRAKAHMIFFKDYKNDSGIALTSLTLYFEIQS